MSQNLGVWGWGDKNYNTCKLKGKSWILVASVWISLSDRIPDWSVSTSSKNLRYVQRLNCTLQIIKIREGKLHVPGGRTCEMTSCHLQGTCPNVTHCEIWILTICMVPDTCGIRIFLPSCWDNTFNTLVITCQSHRRTWRGCELWAALALSTSRKFRWKARLTCLAVPASRFVDHVRHVCRDFPRCESKTCCLEFCLRIGGNRRMCLFSCLPVCLLSVK